jgi:glutamate racemase
VGSKKLAGYAEDDLAGVPVADAALRQEIAAAFVDDGKRTDIIVLACTHYPLLIERLRTLATWPVNFIDPAPAIARRVVDLLGRAPPMASTGATTAIFTSGRSRQAVLGRFGIQVQEAALPPV